MEEDFTFRGSCPFLSHTSIQYHWFNDLRHLLLGGVCQLVLPPAVITLLDPGVAPQVLDRLHVGALKLRHRFVVNAPNKFRFLLKIRVSNILLVMISRTDRAWSILVLDFEEVHGSDHGLHGHEDVLVD